MALLWTLLIIGFIILEASTAQFVCIWFAGGALAGLICALFNTSIYLQITLFVAVSAVLLLLTKKLVLKLKKGKSEKTNVDALIGQTAIVTESISNNRASGTARIGGMFWSARSENGADISEGSLVTIERIDGVKLIVSNKEEE